MMLSMHKKKYITCILQKNLLGNGNGRKKSFPFHKNMK